MSEDAFESEVRKFVDKQNGGDLTARVVYDMLKAVDSDGNARHEESMLRLKELEDAMSSHVAWTEAESLPRLVAVENWCHEWEAGCVLRNEETDKRHLVVHAEHLAADHKHAPRRSSDPPDSDFGKSGDREDEEMRVSFRIGRYVLASLAVVAMTVAINYFVLYRGQKTQLATSRSNAAALSALVIQQHQDTTDLLNLLRAEHNTPSPTPTP